MDRIDHARAAKADAADEARRQAEIAEADDMSYEETEWALYEIERELYASLGYDFES